MTEKLDSRFHGNDKYTQQNTNSKFQTTSNNQNFKFREWIPACVGMTRSVLVGLCFLMHEPPHGDEGAKRGWGRNRKFLGIRRAGVILKKL